MGQLKRSLAVLAVVSSLLTAAGGGVVQAQGAPPATAGNLESEYDAAFQEMLKQPANLDVLFKFATLASQTGDLEGAVSALERMLLINPDLPRVRLELGVLYFRLGSFEVARTYLEAALKTPNLPPDVRERAERFMAEVEARQNPSRFTGDFFLGWRYQTNANLGPSGSTVRLFGQSANLNQASSGQADWGVVGSMQIRHTYDFGRQDKSQLESTLTAYASRQFQVQTANVSLLDFTSGPRFQAFQGIFEDVTLKPFGTAGQIWVYDTPYYGSYGGGLEGTVLVTDRLRNMSNFVFRRHNHTDTWYLTTNSTYSGIEFSGTTSFQHQLSSLVTLFLNGTGTRFEADLTPIQSYELWGTTVGFSFRFLDLLFKSNLPWAINLTYTYQWWRYDVPDPTVDPDVQRRQLDSILNLVLSVPFDDRTTFSLSGGRFIRSSNLPNYAFNNNNVMFGISWRF